MNPTITPPVWATPEPTATETAKRPVWETPETTASEAARPPVWETPEPTASEAARRPVWETPEPTVSGTAKRPVWETPERESSESKSTTVEIEIPLIIKAPLINPAWAEEVVTSLGLSGQIVKAVAQCLATALAQSVSKQTTRRNLTKLVFEAVTTATE